jgi:DUF4097 and DUF4098 domain-containing protein YvlB
MKLQRFEVSGEPQLKVVSYSNLDITGGHEGEVAIKVYGSEKDLEVQREDEQLTITVRARCKIGCPRATNLTLEAAHGDARVRRVVGPITAGVLHGDSLFQDVGPMTLEAASGDIRIRTVNGKLQLSQASGDVQIRSANGDVQLGQTSGDVSVHDVKGSLACENVSGDVSVRGVEGLVSCSSVSGDLSADFLEGGLEAVVSGDAALRTDFTPGCSYRVTASGDVAVKFPTGANARFQVTAMGDIRHKVDWSEISEPSGATLTGRMGDGEANVEITAGGDVTLRSKDDAKEFIFSFEAPEEDLDLELESMSEEIERSIEAHMARLNAQLEAELSRIDHTAIQRKVKQATEKARRQAERAAEQARLRAERAQRRWQRMGAQRPSPAAPPPARPQRPPSEPVSEDERLLILQMIQEGKITTEEAARLLEALEG